MNNMFKMLIFKYLAILIGFATASVLQVEKCKLEDSKCMVSAFQKALPIFLNGIPELGIEVLDVMKMDDVDFNLSGLQFSLKDGRLTGLKGAIIDQVKWDTEKKKLNIEYHLNCIINGHYKASGQILILPITGDGQMEMKLNNAVIKLFIDYVTEKGKDGKLRMIPKKLNYEFDVKDGTYFDLTNLFNGNKELSDATLKFLNENSKQISVEFGNPLMEVIAKKIFKNVKTFLVKMPIEDIAIV